MSMVGTFDGFTASRLGIYAAQQSLRVVGNNISNISTPGYTRQRVDQYSFKAGANDMYRSVYDNHVGSGAMIAGINQIRDPYLDIRYRTTSTETYHYDTWLSGLRDIASILDEVGMGENKGDGLLYAQLQDLAEKLRSFSADPTDGNDGLVRESANALAALFRNYAGRLDQLYAGTKESFNDSITEVNNILVKIRDLNKSIRESEIHGDMALEMRDERNRQIDALSQYMDIKVQYSYEDIGGGIQVEKLTISLNNANPDISVHSDESLLVDGVFVTQLSVPEEKPALNSYADQYWYLKGYTYLKKIPADDEDALSQYLRDNNLLSDDFMPDDFAMMVPPPPTTTDEDGNVYYLVGTNDPNVDGIFTEPNDNFTIQLGKLMNSKGEEWKSNTTAWVEVDRSTAIANARFAYTIGTKLDEVGEGFIIVDANGDEHKYTVVASDTPGDGEISLATAQDPALLAAFLAEEFGKLEKYKDYEVTSEGAQLIFSAKDPENPPADLPSLSVTDESDTNWITVGKRQTVPAKTYDEQGNVTTSVSYVQADGKWYRVTVGTTYSYEVPLDDNDLRGILQAQREMLTEEGEFSGDYDVLIDEEAAIKRGIPYYQKALDLLAQKLAQAYNELNTGYLTDKDGYYIKENGDQILLADLNELDEEGNPVRLPISSSGLTAGQRQNLINNSYILQNGDGYAIDKNGNLIKDAQGNPIQVSAKDEAGNLTPIIPPSIPPEAYDKIVVDMDKMMEELEGVRPGGVLFSNGNNGNDTTGINARNIDISAGWSHGSWGLVPKYEKIFVDENNPDGLEQSTKNTNADHMVTMIEKSLTYDPRDLFGSDATGPLLFHGSFNDFLSNIMAVEASDERITNSRLNTAVTSLTELDYSREGVSGVDLNDEAMDMMQFSKAMNAAMRVMTTIDEVLDRLINNTGIAGR